MVLIASIGCLNIGFADRWHAGKDEGRDGDPVGFRSFLQQELIDPLFECRTAQLILPLFQILKLAGYRAVHFLKRKDSAINLGSRGS